MSNDDMISEIERTLDKAGVGTQRGRRHNLDSVFPSQAERVEMLVEQRDEARAALTPGKQIGLANRAILRSEIEDIHAALDKAGVRQREPDEHAPRLLASERINLLAAEADHIHADRVRLADELREKKAANARLRGALEEALGDVDTMEAAISADLSSYDAEGLLNTFGHMRRSMSAAIAKARGEG